MKKKAAATKRRAVTKQAAPVGPARQDAPPTKVRTTPEPGTRPGPAPVKQTKASKAKTAGHQGMLQELQKALATSGESNRRLLAQQIGADLDSKDPDTAWTRLTSFLSGSA